VRKGPVILTGDPPSFPGVVANGAGLRAQGLAEALRRLGHDVLLAVPEEGFGGSPIPSLPNLHVAKRHELANMPSIVGWGGRPESTTRELWDVTAFIYQHWGLMAEALPVWQQLGTAARPVVIDLAGPHLLERLYWRRHNLKESLDNKIACLALADGVLVGGAWQAAWFAPFLEKAWGELPPTLNAPGSIPNADDFRKRWVSVSPLYVDFLSPIEPFPFRDHERPVIVYAGGLLPWQDPTWAMRHTLAWLTELGRGELLVIGSETADVPMHPEMRALEAELHRHPRARRLGRIPTPYLLSIVAGADVVLDLMAPNPERRLAVPTRTAIARRLGTPIIYNEYSELSDAWKDQNDACCIPWENGAELTKALWDRTGRRKSGDELPSIAFFPQEQDRAARESAGALDAWLRNVKEPHRSQLESTQIEAFSAATASPPATWQVPSPAIQAANDGLRVFHEALNQPAAVLSAVSVPPKRSALHRLIAPALAPLAGLMAAIVAITMGSGRSK